MSKAVPEEPVIVGNYILEILSTFGGAKYLRTSLYRGDTEKKMKDLGDGIFNTLEAVYHNKNLKMLNGRCTAVYDVPGFISPLRVTIYPGEIVVHPTGDSKSLGKEELKTFRKFLGKIDEVLVKESST